MICGQCGTHNVASFRTCRNCEAPLGQLCLTCGFENPAASKFCGGCGARLRLAIERARAHQARSLELRAALDLYDLQAAEGRPEEGREVLAGLLKGFTQGLDRPEPARARSAVLRTAGV